MRRQSSKSCRWREALMSDEPRVRRVFHHDRGDDAVAENVEQELQFHFDMTVGDLMSQGWSEEDARREAVRRFGDIEEMRARLKQIDRQLEQRRRIGDLLFGFWQD